MLVLLTGCSSLSKTDCLGFNWEQIGFEHGRSGNGASNLDSYQESCSEYGVNVDQDSYRQGLIKGMTLFCDVEDAFGLGKEGYNYTITCPANFTDEYEIGYEFYIANSRIHKIQMTMNNNAATVNKLQAGIAQANVRLNSGDLSVFEENQVRQNIDSMTGQITGYEQSTEELEMALTQSRQELQSLQAHHNR